MSYSYSAEVTQDAESHPTLGAEYFEARDVANRFLSHWQDEHAKQLNDAIMGPVLDMIREKVWDSFRDWLLADTEQNLQGEMRSMVERTVNALIGGENWARVKYIDMPYREGQKVRETLAKLYSDEIKDGRIRDLEAEVKRLEDLLRFRTGY